MGFCTKCGTKLNDGDVFCPNCGSKVQGENDELEYKAYGDINNFPTTKPQENVDNSNNTLPLAKGGFIMSVISLSMTALGFVGAIIAYNAEQESLYSISMLMFYLGLIGGVVSLGLAIPGFIITKKKGFKKVLAIAGLVLAIIAVSLLLVYYIYDEYFFNDR